MTTTTTTTTLRDRIASAQRRRYLRQTAMLATAMRYATLDELWRESFVSGLDPDLRDIYARELDKRDRRHRRD